MSLKLQNDRRAATGSRRWFSKTLIAGYVVLGLVLWQTVQVVGGGELSFKHSAKPQTGSTKLHSDRDAPSRKNRPTKEPVAAFFERAKRGMTEEEIRGMIADFEAIGSMPDQYELDAWSDYAEKQKDWYVKGLAEGLSLTSEQNREARTILTQDLDDKISKIKSATVEINPLVVVGLIIQMNLSERLRFGDFSSWGVCNLSEEQIRLTYKRTLEDKYAARRKQEIENGSHSTSCHTLHVLVMHDALTGEYVDYPPPSPRDLGCTLLGTVSGGIIDVTNTFPLTPDQKIADHRDDLLAQAKLLHPAQLRMALLMNPGVVVTLKHQLDNPRK